MCRLSNGLIAIVNILTLIISIPLLYVCIHSQIHVGINTECQKFLQVPLLSFSLFLVILSLLGLIGACCRVSWFLWIYIVVMFFLIMGLFGFTIFTFIVTNKGAGKALSGRGINDYRLGDYSNWLQKHVVDGHRWETIKTCLMEGHLCQTLNGIRVEEEDKHLNVFRTFSTIQSGCCKPPTYCGFTFVNATFWEVPKTGPEAQDTDCTTWSNNQDVLCFNCKSCKGGVLASLKRDWKNLTIFNTSMLLFLIIVYTIAGCAFRNTRNDRRRRGYA